jgi:hypothetical protein
MPTQFSVFQQPTYIRLMAGNAPGTLLLRRIAFQRTLSLCYTLGQFFFIGLGKLVCNYMTTSRYPYFVWPLVSGAKMTKQFVFSQFYLTKSYRRQWQFHIKEQRLIMLRETHVRRLLKRLYKKSQSMAESTIAAANPQVITSTVTYASPIRLQPVQGVKCSQSADPTKPTEAAVRGCRWSTPWRINTTNYQRSHRTLDPRLGASTGLASRDDARTSQQRVSTQATNNHSTPTSVAKAKTGGRSSVLSQNLLFFGQRNQIVIKNMIGHSYLVPGFCVSTAVVSTQNLQLDSTDRLQTNHTHSSKVNLTNINSLGSIKGYWKVIRILPNMLGYRLGEFVESRKPVKFPTTSRK